MTDPAQIAKSLTRAQREYLTSKAQWRRPICWAQERWMAFPPPNTHTVLCRLGLTDRSGQILDTGLAVRAHIMEEEGRG